jgi:2Fe-2S ferredoxin
MENLQMVGIVFVKPDGERVEVEAEIGHSIMEAALNNDIDEVLAECGGSMSCATCHVHIAPEWADKLESRTEMEAELVDCAIDPDEYSRLSCQIEMSDALDGIVINLPASQN